MKEYRHAVWLGATEVGVLHQRGDHVRFEFVPGYWETPARPVLGAWFEDNRGTTPKAALRLPPWFSNLLPEGQLRDWIARDRGVSADREMELLLQTGHDLPGAVTVVPDAGAPLPWRADPIEVGESGSIAGDSIKFSLAGVGLKFSMVRQGERFTLPASGAQGEWIVKLPDPAHAHVPENEFGMMALARDVGITVPETHLVHRDDLPRLPDSVWPGEEEYAFAVRRFDRTATGRVHMEDFAQVRGFYGDGSTRNKYSGAFETVAALCYRDRDVESLEEFARRMAFNVAIGNGDAHLKNWTLLYADPRRAKLSPAYDLVSTASYFPDGHEDLGLSWGGSRRLSSASKEPFMRLVRRLDCPELDLAEIASSTIDRVSSMWDRNRYLPPALGFVADWLDVSIREVSRRF